MNVACVVTAAGLSSRFGADKLSQDLNGLPMLAHTLLALDKTLFVKRVAVVPNTRNGVADMAVRFGFETVFNPNPELGISGSVRLGLNAARAGTDAVLFCVGDQPFLTAGTVRTMAAMWQEHPYMIVALGYRGIRGNPVIFPKEFFPELLELTGDTGGSSVIKRHLDRLLLYETDNEKELTDFDTKAEWETLC